MISSKYSHVVMVLRKVGLVLAWLRYIVMVIGYKVLSWLRSVVMVIGYKVLS